jgi:leukotriene-A4 hydrolase
MGFPDPHSHANPQQARTEKISLALRVDFSSRTLRGEAALDLAQAREGPLDLDTRDLEIEAVSTVDGRPLRHRLEPRDPILGSRLRIDLPAHVSGVRIRYATSPTASALQWLDLGKSGSPAHRLVYSQCQSIHARSIAPLQDTPAIRARLDLRLTVPSGLRAVVAAESRGREPAGDGESTDHFATPDPIPPHLIGFAVGNFESRRLSHRSAVWAAPALVDAAASELSGVETVLQAAESLFGPYRWGRYDLLVLPPSFPYGGMENPRLSFLSPSLLSGDGAVVNVIAHELAHAWTGNLVTNASANDFWLNEGFAVYAERRILEALQGPELAGMHAAIGRHDLAQTLRRLESHPELTRLRVDLAGLDPDQAYSSVPYEKGYLLLCRLEEIAGRAAWDAFLRGYLDRFAFRSITTQSFLDYLDESLPRVAATAGVLRWIDGPGIPAEAPDAPSQRLTELRILARRAAAGSLPSPAERERIGPAELVVFLQALPAPLPASVCAELDRAFQLGRTRNLEVRVNWILVQLRSGIPEGTASAREVLLSTGRLRHVRAIYSALCAHPELRDLALRIFAEAREGYHPIARARIEDLLRSTNRS